MSSRDFDNALIADFEAAVAVQTALLAARDSGIPVDEEKMKVLESNARAASEKAEAAIAARERGDFSEETENAEHEFIEPATYGEPLTLVSSSNDSVKLALKKLYSCCVWSMDVEAISEVRLREMVDNGKIFTRNHPSGWTIMGEFCSDGLEWVENFSATHQTFGSLRIEHEGDRSYIIATSIAAWNDFVRAHAVTVFDYGGI
jgi:hypothetical protein